MEHNRKVRAAVAENSRREISLKDYEQRSAQALATALDTYNVPSTKALFKAYETALKREHTPSAALCSSYASNQGGRHDLCGSCGAL